jgi:beta-glucosidase/6-phospho-beta-glucosidase/beta-galactosidase
VKVRLELDFDFGTRFARSAFFFGVAYAPYLCEGGYNTPDGPKNSYGHLEAGGVIPRSGEATRFWTDYPAHIRLAASLGLNAFRMGIDWPRVQPSTSLEPHDPPDWDAAALDRYADIVAMVSAHGMQPIVTLYHSTHPAWAGIDLWRSDRGPDLLAGYAIRAVDEVNERLVARGSGPMRHFLIYNEPNQIPLGYYMGGLFPLPQGPDQLLPAYDNLMACYVVIYDGLVDLFERRGWGTPHLGYTLGSQAPYELDRQMSDVFRLRTWGVPRERVAEAIRGCRDRWVARIDDLARSQLTEAQLDRYHARNELMASALPATGLTRTLDALYASPRARKLDYLSLNVYDPLGAARREPRRPGAKAELHWDECAVDPEIYRTYILATNDGNTDLPVYMGENSLANLQEIGGPAKPRPDGWTRERYLKTYLMEMIRCMKEGVPIEGYLYWSLVDDFEWQAGFPPRLGLYSYDYERHRILPTDGFGEPSGEIYAALVKALRSGKKEEVQRAFMYSHAAAAG